MDEQVTQFVADVKLAFKDAKILLFGSRAKGNARPDSDYDFIIISKRFAKIPFVNRAYSVWVKSDAIIAADLLCYAPNEVNRIAKQSVVLRDALKYAVPI